MEELVTRPSRKPRARSAHALLLPAVGVLAASALLLPLTGCAGAKPAARGRSRSDPGPVTLGAATDPVPGDPYCTGYVFDGISIGMTHRELAKIGGVHRAVSADPAMTEPLDSTFVLKARREGRLDDVHIALTGDGSDAKVSHLRATIVVAAGDPWPQTIFTVAGNPHGARATEWIWWDGSCGATMRLTRVDPIGGSGDRVGYILEIRGFP